MDEFHIFVRDGLVSSEAIEKPMAILKEKSLQRFNTNYSEILNVIELLKVRNKEIFACHFVIDENIQPAANQSCTWTNLKSDDTKIIPGNCCDISNAISKLCNDLPLYGSCLVYVAWFKGEAVWRNSSDVEIVVSLMGTLRKLVQWHNAHFTLVSDCEEPGYEHTVSQFVADTINIVSLIEYQDNCLKDKNDEFFWHGKINMVSEGQSICDINNVQMKLKSCKQLTVDISSDLNESQNTTYLWFSQTISFIEIINIYTVPFYLFSSEKVILELSDFSSDSDSSMFDEIFEKMVSTPFSGLLCHLDYSISNDTFLQSSEFSFNEWKKRITTQMHNSQHPKINPHENVNMVHLILTPMISGNKKHCVGHVLQPLNAFIEKLFNSIPPDVLFKHEEEFTNSSEDASLVLALENKHKIDVLIQSQSKCTSTTKTSKLNEKTMFFPCTDVLKKFNKAGKPRSKCPYMSQENKIGQPPKEKICNFSEALKLKYYDVFYNTDISDKKDRESRRLINSYVKFETASICSAEKLSLPQIFVEESPFKSKPRTSSRHNSEVMKKKNWERVAEKLYQKRLQSRSQSVSNMVLRSTPKKASTSTLRRSSTRDSSSLDTTRARKLSVRQHTYVNKNKQLLQSAITDVLSKKGVQENHPCFEKCSKKLYDVSMMFLKELKTAKGLDRIIRKTVDENAKAVLTFFKLSD